MKNKLVYSLIVVAFVGGLFTTAYAGPMLPSITLAGNTQTIGNADIDGNLNVDGTISGGTITSIQNQIDQQYVVFKTPSTIPFPGTEICDDSGGLGQQHQLRINGDSDFMVTGIAFQPTGIDAAADEITIVGIFVDNQNIATRTNDLTGTFTTSFGFDIAGVPTIAGANVPTTISALGEGAQDIVVSIACFAGTVSDITFPEGSIIVSGWKLSSDIITATYG